MAQGTCAVFQVSRRRRARAVPPPVCLGRGITISQGEKKPSNFLETTRILWVASLQIIIRPHSREDKRILSVSLDDRDLV